MSGLNAPIANPGARFLRVLRTNGRAAAPCWLVDTANGRYTLVIPGGDGQYFRYSAVTSQTIAELADAGLITYGKDGEAPEFRWAEPGDTRNGCPVRLTDAGLKEVDA